jgi:hypothetical protein
MNVPNKFKVVVRLTHYTPQSGGWTTDCAIVIVTTSYVLMKLFALMNRFSIE